MAGCKPKNLCIRTKEKKSKKNSSGNKKTGVYFNIREDQVPIIYSPIYDIRFLGLENLHPFDSKKWGRIFLFLEEAKIVDKETAVEPVEATEQDLRVVHPSSYLQKLQWSYYVATVTEIPCVAAMPNMLVQRSVLKPFRYQTGGSILAGKLAAERGWAINIGGGFHHCSAESGGGFCAYADISLCINFLFNHNDSITSAMIVDLDAHQGNGHERDFMFDSRVYILDVYNRNIYPRDEYAKGAIRRKVELNNMTEDEEYLLKVSAHLEKALNEFDAGVIVFNAGTDILRGDPLGNLSISAEGIIARDEIVFAAAKKRNVPIVMLTSGGYQKSTARIIADSIINLHQKGLIQKNLNNCILGSSSGE